MTRWKALPCAVLNVLMMVIHIGKIALWNGDDPEPVQVFPYSAASLPPADQRALEIGIPIGSRAQLNQLLEDYLS